MGTFHISSDIFVLFVSWSQRRSMRWRRQSPRPTSSSRTPKSPLWPSPSTWLPRWCGRRRRSRRQEVSLVSEPHDVPWCPCLTPPLFNLYPPWTQDKYRGQEKMLKQGSCWEAQGKVDSKKIYLGSSGRILFIGPSMELEVVRDCCVWNMRSLGLLWCFFYD